MDRHKPSPPSAFHSLPSIVALVTSTLGMTCYPVPDAAAKSPSNANRNANATGDPTGNATGVATSNANEPGLEPESRLIGVRTATGDPDFVVDGDLSIVDWESMAGKTVRINGPLVVVDTYDLLRRGQITVARERLMIPTERIDPNDRDALGTSFEGGNNVAAVVAAEKRNDRSTIIIDDGTPQQNLFPPKLLPGLGRDIPTLRCGSVINGFVGRVQRAGRLWLFIPTEPLDLRPAPRPPRPSLPGGDTVVASFNVLNYFTTIDDGRNRARGADSNAELIRQRKKTVAAIHQLDADVVGLMEIENSDQAESDLIDALNRNGSSNPQDRDQHYTGVGRPRGFTEAPGGGDSIRVGILYNDLRVEPVGPPGMIVDAAFGNARAPIFQTFRSRRGGEPFTVIVNHFKSKGGANNADPANKNKGDGQAAYNAARRGQADAIVRYVKAHANSRTRVLIIGDLNAYAQEDPIDRLRAAGFVDLHEQHGDAEPDYSFNYYGQSGTLDHAFATPALADDVTAAIPWHINADEPRWLDYNTEDNPVSLYHPDPYRSSDHDPLLIAF